MPPQEDAPWAPAHAASVARPSGGGRRQRRILLTLLGVALVTVVLRAPLSVVTLLGAPVPDAGPHPVPSPVPEAAAVGSVVDGAAAPEGDGRGPTTARDAREDGGTADGRWGASPVRPGGLEIALEEFRGGWRLEAGAEEAVALAVVAAHEWAGSRAARASGAGSVGADTGAGAIVAVEAIERPGTLHAVVTLLVVMGSELHRIAVPIAFGADGPTVAGTAWPLPAPTSTPSTLTGTAVGDPELLEAARRALDAVGIPGERLSALEATEGWPFIARLDDDADGHPWLRWHLDRFVVSGLPLRSGGGSR